MRKFRLPLIVGFALAVRVVFAAIYISEHSTRALGTIPFLFEPGNIAASIATGHGFASPFRVDTGPTAWMTPIYPLLLAGIFRVLGVYSFGAFLAAAALNIACSTLTCIPLFAVARRVKGIGTATLATFLWAIFPNAILLPYESMFDASLSALLVATILWATVAIAESYRARDWCLYGLLWGFGLMTNAALVSLLPFLLAWAGRRHPRKSLAAAAVVVLCCVPWAVRNYRVFHAFVPLRSVGGLALWLGNNEQAQSLTPGRLHPITNQSEREKYVELGEIAYMRAKQAQALTYMAAHPGAVFRLAGDRFVAIWTGGSTNPVRDLVAAKSPRFYWVVVLNIFAAIGSLAGVVALWRKRSPWLFPLAVIPLVFPLVYYFALAPPRYRHPIDPVLLLLTGIACSHLSNYTQNKKRPLSGRTTVQ